MRQAGIIDLLGPLLAVYDRLDLVVDAPADELVFANALEKGEREGSRPAVRRYVVFEVNRSVGYFLLQCLPGFRRRGDVGDEQILLIRQCEARQVGVLAAIVTHDDDRHV